MTTLDALRVQIDLIQHHTKDSERLRAALSRPRRETGGVTVGSISRRNSLLSSPEHMADYIQSSNMAVQSLEHAQTVFVADWVIDTLEDAVDSFPVEYAPAITEMPFDNGFAFFGRRVLLQTRPNFSLEIEAASWKRMGSNVLVALYGYSPESTDIGRFRQDIEIKSAYSMELGVSIEDSIASLPARGNRPWLEIDGDTFTTVEIDPEITGAFMEAEIRWAMRFVASLWLFMGDKITALESASAPRAMRRQMERDRLQMEPKVHTIILRAVERPAGWEERPGRDYQVRWVVRGHWHRFWVGAKDGPDRRLVPRWVSAYVKGPADAPLISPIKLFSVAR